MHFVVLYLYIHQYLYIHLLSLLERYWRMSFCVARKCWKGKVARKACIRQGPNRSRWPAVRDGCVRLCWWVSGRVWSESGVYETADGRVSPGNRLMWLALRLIRFSKTFQLTYWFCSVIRVLAYNRFAVGIAQLRRAPGTRLVNMRGMYTARISVEWKK